MIDTGFRICRTGEKQLIQNSSRNNVLAEEQVSMLQFGAVVTMLSSYELNCLFVVVAVVVFFYLNLSLYSSVEMGRGLGP